MNKSDAGREYSDADILCSGISDSHVAVKSALMPAVVRASSLIANAALQGG